MADAPVLIDALARRRITDGLGESLFVEAGAGAGKTSALVARVVGLLRDGAPIDSIAAITFTEAAATELRVRVRAALADEVEAHPTPALLSALQGVETAAFTTLHGFALRLLGEFPIEAGLPPGFSVQDEIRSTLTFEDDLTAFLVELGDDDDEAELQFRGEVLGIKPAQMHAIARRFDDNWDLLGARETEPTLPPLHTEPLLARLRAVAALGHEGRSPDCKLRPLLAQLELDVSRLSRLEPLFQVEWLASAPVPRSTVGRKADWPDGLLAEIKAELKQLKADVADFVATHQAAVLTRYGALLEVFITERVERRRARGELAFHDLLVLARSLLRRDERVRLALHQRYRHLLLDEFQDTDPIQIELAVLLAHPGPVEERPWVALAPELAPGRLVVVGDPKQSIYRFRRADIGVYDDAGRSIGNDPVVLSTNFRSVPGVIEWVNAVFGDEIGDGVPGEQPPYVPLVAHRPPLPPEAGPAVTLLGGPLDESVPAVRDAEALDVAAAIVAIDEAGWQVRGDDGAPRELRLSDIAILIPSRLSLPSLDAALSAAGVPFRPETSSLVYATQEIRDLTAALRAVANPGNRIDVVAALRSTVFGIGDDDLFDWWERTGGAWDYRGDVEPDLADSAVGAAFAQLRVWHDDHWFCDPATLIDRIVVERRLRELALAGARPRDGWRRHRFLAEQARRFVESQGGDLQDFCEWAEVQASEAARVTEPIPHEPDHDAVRILTIHGSKGLEFPVVVLAGAPTEEQAGVRGPAVIFPDGGGAPEISLGGGRRTENFEVMAPVEEMLDRAERVRLHYVAATRARDHLIVSAYHSTRRRAPSMGRRSFERSSAHPDLWTTLEPDRDRRLRARAAVQLTMADIDRHDDAVARWTAEQERIDAGRRLGGVRTATSLTAQGPADPGPERARPWRQGRAGTSIGSAVHAVLQHVDLATGADLDALARHWAEVEGVAEHADQVAARADQGRRSATVQRAIGRRMWRELPFAVPVGDTVLDGVIDLLVELDDGLLVVDYKTDGVADDGDANRLVDHYRWQAAGYAEAMARLTGRPVVGARFVFCGVDRVVERDVGDLDALRAEVVARLEAGE